jgi:hypothetical protein
MRRLLLSVAGLCVLAAFAGCNHMAGCCDCDTTPTIGCVYCPGCLTHAAVKVEPIKEAPKMKPETPDKE